jgi:hypothetical protein
MIIFLRIILDKQVILYIYPNEINKILDFYFKD